MSEASGSADDEDFAERASREAAGWWRGLAPSPPVRVSIASLFGGTGSPARLDRETLRLAAEEVRQRNQTKPPWHLYAVAARLSGEGARAGGSWLDGAAAREQERMADERLG